MIINVDFDGVLIPSNFEKRFFHVDGSWRVSIDDYIKMVNESPIPQVNHKLLMYLHNLSEMGNVVRLFTNRNDELKKKTFKVLDSYKSIFDSFLFCEGLKSQTKVEGIVMDNESKYLSCGSQVGILYEWNGGNAYGLHRHGPRLW
jgi:hypothetical protein